MSVALFLLLLLLLGLLWFLLLALWMKRPRNFPPGPQPVPLFGNLLQINPKNPLISFDKLARRYGNVYSVFIGGRPTVVLHGLQALKAALVTRSVDFAGRPQGLMLNHVTRNKGFIMADYGPHWREHRRFAMMTLKNFGMGKQSMENRILEETSHICAHLERAVGTSIDPEMLFHRAASNIISAVLFGCRYDYEDKLLQFIVNVFADHAKLINSIWAMVYDIMPYLRWLPLPLQKGFQNLEVIKGHIFGVMAEHKKTRVPGDPRDLVDCYLDEIDKRGSDGSLLDEERLLMMLMDLYFAGTDTTSNTIRMALLYLMAYPGVQAQCQQEIDSVLGGRSQISFEDRHSMPYTQAVIHELQRVANIAPLSVYHTTTRETHLLGYDIPKGTLVIPNLSSALFEESLWERPSDFNPSHFLNEHGEFVKPEAFLAFSAGHRVCLGEVLARMELFLILVTLLHRFRFIWPADAGTPDVTPVFGGIQTPKPYRLRVEFRDR